MIGGVDLVDPDVSFPTHIMSNVFRSNKKVNYCLIIAFSMLVHCSSKQKLELEKL